MMLTNRCICCVPVVSWANGIEVEEVFPVFFFFLIVQDSAHRMRAACSLPASEVQDHFLGIYLFRCLFWTSWVIAVPGLFLVVAGGGDSALQCGGFSLQ